MQRWPLVVPTVFALAACNGRGAAGGEEPPGNPADFVGDVDNAHDPSFENPRPMGGALTVPGIRDNEGRTRAEMEAQGPAEREPGPIGTNAPTQGQPGQLGIDSSIGMPYFERTLDGVPVVASEDSAEGATQAPKPQRSGDETLATVSVTDEIRSACGLDESSTRFSFDPRIGSVGEGIAWRQLATCVQTGELSGRQLLVTTYGESSNGKPEANANKDWVQAFTRELSAMGLDGNFVRIVPGTPSVTDKSPTGASQAAASETVPSQRRIEISLGGRAADGS